MVRKGRAYGEIWTGPLDHWTNRLLIGLFLDLSVFREGWEAEVVVLVNATD